MMIPKLFEERASKLASQHPSNWVQTMASQDTFAGVNVTPYNAMQLAAIYAAVRVLSESIAVVSVDLFKRRNDGPGKDVERDHPASWLVREDANEDTSAFIFRETLQGHLCTWGNGYAQIDFDGGGSPQRLVQRRPDYVEPDRNKAGKLYYRVTPVDGGEDIPVPSEEMLHVPGLSFNGLRGFSPVEMLRETIGRGMAVGRYRSAFFGNRMQFNGAITHPLSLDQEPKEQLIAELEKLHKGPADAFRTFILDEGMDWKSIGFPNDAAQMIETSIFEIQDVARAFRLPLHLLQELTHATFSNIEHQDLEFVKYSLLQWCRRWESELNRKLLTVQERKAGLFFEFNLDTFMRGDFKTRMEGFSLAIGAGMLSPNEARSLDNHNPYEGGDEYFVQSNWQTVENAKKSPPEVVVKANDDEEPDDERAEAREDAFVGRETVRDLSPLAQRSAEARWKLLEVFEGLLLAAAGRMVNAEVKAIRRELQKVPTGGAAEFRVWLDGFFARHKEFVRDIAGPVLLGLMEAASSEALREVGGDEDQFRGHLEAFHDEYVESFGSRQAAISLSQIESIMREADTDLAVVEGVGSVLDGWEEARAQKVASSEASRVMNAVTMAAYAFGGVRALRWVWNGGECKICPNLHGKVVEIGQPFVRKGDNVGDPETVGFKVKRTGKHPPLHPPECRCTISPA